MTGHEYKNREEPGSPRGGIRENKPDPSLGARPPPRTSLAWVIATTAIMVLASVVGLVVVGAGAASTPTTTPHSSGAIELASAQASLERGGDSARSHTAAPGSSDPPPARYAMMMTWDSADGYVLLFGGISATGPVLDDTWTYLAGTWTQLSPMVSPSAREGGMMTYDAADGYVLLFGGYPGSGTHALDDTWTFHAGVWTQLRPHVHPPDTEWAGIAYDPQSHYVVMFGGDRIIGTTKYDTTWSFHHGKWKELSPAVSPLARNYAAMAYDPATGYIVLFSGLGTADVYYDDTWEFSGGTWTNITPALSPTDRDADSLVYDPAYQALILYGGGAPSGTFNQDTWEFTAGGFWSQLSPPANPGGLVYYGLAYDASDQYLVLFGGQDQSGTVLANTWQFTGGTWTEL
jgi:outer membrane murein-binding lipoprotein Lpp